MSDKTEYTVVEPEFDDSEQYEDVHLEVLGLKLDLPNLNSADLPIELVQTILIIKSKPVLSEEEESLAMATCLAYFEQIQPNLWRRLRTAGHAMEWLAEIVKVWAVESGLDPKASTSSASSQGIRAR